MLRAEICKLRRKIDRIDNDILKLLAERLECGISIGLLKDEVLSRDTKESFGAYDPKREEEIITRLISCNSRLPKNGVEAIFREIISMCRNKAHKARVCLLGEDRFLYNTGLTLLGRSCEYKTCFGDEEFVAMLAANEFNLGLAYRESVSEKLINEIEQLGYHCNTAFATSKFGCKSASMILFAHE